jgi:dual specificity MAP kinase phosphatase
MLHALGITHVVSVGECALVPPPHFSSSGACFNRPSPGAHFVAGKGPGGQGSLWIEEREGRIKVLDIKGVCDDGIDTLEPQLEPICDWIEKARLGGGQVLVHCRVGVSRSATVTVSFLVCLTVLRCSLVVIDRVCDETPEPPSCRCISHCSLSTAFGADSAKYAVAV